MNLSSTSDALNRTNQKQIQKQTSVYTGSNEPGDDVPVGYHDLMGVCREAGLTDMKRNGSVLKALLKKYDCRELEAVIRGLRLVNPTYRSLVPLNSCQHGEGVWAEAAKCYYRSVNKRKPKREGEPTQIGAILKQLSDAA